MNYKSDFYNVDVRKDIVKDFTRFDGTVDDMMAGLHEIRTRMAKEILPSDIAPVKKIKIVSPRTAANTPTRVIPFPEK